MLTFETIASSESFERKINFKLEKEKSLSFLKSTTKVSYLIESAKYFSMKIRFIKRTDFENTESVILNYPKIQGLLNCDTFH